MTETEIEVNFQPPHQADLIPLRDRRPSLTYGEHPTHGNGWTLWYLDHPDSPTAGVEEYFIPGDLTDVDEVVADARRKLSLSSES